MTTRRFSAAAASILLVAACTLDTLPSVSANSEVSRLQSMGYKVVARNRDANTTILRYSGPINASVECGQQGQMQTLKPRIASAGGAVQDFRLNAFLVLSPGSDGVIRSDERDGLYVVSKITRPSSRSAASTIESITFEPGKRGTFASGLSCRAT
ncbi:MAG: pyruvate/2-oxoglutarate dehydrogenase complex [Pseudomonadota bacterium]